LSPRWRPAYVARLGRLSPPALGLARSRGEQIQIERRRFGTGVPIWRVSQLLEVVPGQVRPLKNSFVATVFDDIADRWNSLPVLPTMLDMPHLDAVKLSQQSAQRQRWAYPCHASQPAENNTGKVTTNGKARYSAVPKWGRGCNRHPGEISARNWECPKKLIRDGSRYRPYRP
jgi:hypothetical protein